MANMSYCRFRNTAIDVADCLNVLSGDHDDYVDNMGVIVKESVSKDEKESAKSMFEDFIDFIAEHDLVTDKGFGMELSTEKFEKLFEGRECSY